MKEFTEVNRFKRVLLINKNEIDVFINSKIIRASLFAGEVIIKLTIEEGIKFFNQESIDDLPEVIFFSAELVNESLQFMEEVKKLDDYKKSITKIVIISDASPDTSHEIFRNAKMLSIDIFKKPLTLESLRVMEFTQRGSIQGSA